MIGRLRPGSSSIIVGVLLAVVAVVLIDRNRRFLVGRGVTPDIERSMARRLLDRRDIARITYLHLEFVGPRKLYLVAAVDLQGDHPEHEVAVALRRIERELEDHETVEEAVLTLEVAGFSGPEVVGPGSGQMVEVSSHPSSVPLGGIAQNGLGSGRDYIVEVAVDPVEPVLSQLLGDSQRHRTG